MSNNKFKVLIVEDEANICSFIRNAPDHQRLSGSGGPHLYHGPDSVLPPTTRIWSFGVLWPCRTGTVWTIIGTVRQEYMTPIVVLSARTDEMDKIEALDLGANDYITKPFSTGELLARVRAALRLNR